MGRQSSYIPAGAPALPTLRHQPSVSRSGLLTSHIYRRNVRKSFGAHCVSKLFLCSFSHAGSRPEHTVTSNLVTPLSFSLLSFSTKIQFLSNLTHVFVRLVNHNSSETKTITQHNESHNIQLPHIQIVQIHSQRRLVRIGYQLRDRR